MGGWDSDKVRIQGWQLLSRLDPKKASVKAVVIEWSEEDRYEESLGE